MNSSNMVRYFSFIIIIYLVPGAKIEFEVRLAARNEEGGKWIEVGSANATRNLDCTRVRINVF